MIFKVPVHWKLTAGGNQGINVIGTHPKQAQVFREANKQAVSQHWTLDSDPPEKQPHGPWRLEQL